jgi:predicted Fe-Mo cluster-binding NifX family protein
VQEIDGALVMKTAFAVWNNRIAPVFDVARRVILVESRVDATGGPKQILLAGDEPLQKAQQLSELGADSLVCGAISRALQAILTARGIRVIAYVAGDVDEIIDAWRQPDFEPRAYAMPRGRRNRHRYPTLDQHKEAMMQTNRGGGGRGMGGRGQGGQGRCRQRPPAAGGARDTAAGACVCTQCGYSEAHERGNPCMQKKCPQCGAVMSRQ